MGGNKIVDGIQTDVQAPSTDGFGAAAVSGSCRAPDIVATGPDAGSASVGGGSSVDVAMLTGTSSVTGDGAEAEGSFILLAAGDVER
jgi:hypothetical protein